MMHLLSGLVGATVRSLSNNDSMLFASSSGRKKEHSSCLHGSKLLNGQPFMGLSINFFVDLFNDKD